MSKGFIKGSEIISSDGVRHDKVKILQYNIPKFYLYKGKIF